MKARGPITIGVVAWLGAGLLSVGLGWVAGSSALAPVTVPGPTATTVVQVTVPQVAAQSAPKDWSANPATPFPAGIPEGRILLTRLQVGTYVGIPANARVPCSWRREGSSDMTGKASINESGSSQQPMTVTLRDTDVAFSSQGCIWRYLGAN